MTLSPLEYFFFLVSFMSQAICFPEGTVLLVRLSPFLPPQSLQFPFLRANFISLSLQLGETPGPWRIISNPAASLGVTVNPHEPRWQQGQGMSRLPEMEMKGAQEGAIGNDSHCYSTSAMWRAALNALI